MRTSRMNADTTVADAASAGRGARETSMTRVLASGLALGMLALGGCSIAGPTYGTDKRVGEQLIEDLASVTTLRKDTPAIDYKPRPGLVPAPDGAGLPAPQSTLARGDAAWENSPEALRKRLAAESAADPRNSPLRDVDTRSLAAQSKLYDPETGKRVNMRKRAARIGSPNERGLLSDPPVSYRQAAATAPTGDLGTPEYKKERIRAAARGESKGALGKLRDLLPF